MLADDERIPPRRSSSHTVPVSVYARRWRPSKYEVDPLQELVLTDPSIDALYHTVRLPRLYFKILI